MANLLSYAQRTVESICCLTNHVQRTQQWPPHRINNRWQTSCTRTRYTTITAVHHAFDVEVILKKWRVFTGEVKKNKNCSSYIYFEFCNPPPCLRPPFSVPERHCLETASRTSRDIIFNSHHYNGTGRNWTLRRLNAERQTTMASIPPAPGLAPSVFCTVGSNHSRVPNN